MAKKKKSGKLSKEEKKQKEKEERQRFLQEQRELIQHEIQNNDEKKKYLTKEQESRTIHLDSTLKRFAALEDQMWDDRIENRHKLEWELYTKGDRLPNPSSVTEMNTYLYRWHVDDSSYEMENIPARTDEILALLETLELFIEDPIQATLQRQENWAEIYRNFSFELRKHIDEATFRLLRFMEKNMKLKGLNEVNFNLPANNFNIYLWALLPLPKPMVPPPQIMRKCAFDLINVAITLPQHLDNIDFVVRALYKNYDHLSKISRSFIPKALPEERTLNLRQRAEYEKEQLVIIQRDLVDVRLKKLNELRGALIDEITKLIPIIEADKGDRKAKKKEKGPASEEEEKAREAKEKHEEYIKNLMKELDLLPDGYTEKLQLHRKDKKDKGKGKKGKKGKKSVASTDGDTDNAVTSESDAGDDASSKKGKKGKKKKKGGGEKKKKRLSPEKEYKRALERLKSLPLNQSAAEIFNENEESEENKFIEYMTMECEGDELNLRKYVIFGGMIEVNLFFMLTQPYEHPEKYIVSIIKLPPVLENLPPDVLLPQEIMETEEEEEEVAEEDDATRKSAFRGMTTTSLAAFRETIQKSIADPSSLEETAKTEVEDEKVDPKKSMRKSKVSKKSKVTLTDAPKVAAHESITSRRVSEKRLSSGDPAEDKRRENERKISRLSSMIDAKDVKDLAEQKRSVYPLVKLKMRDTLIFFDKPLLVVWDDVAKYWSTDGCSNVEIDKQNLTFELKKCGPVGFATLRHANLPYQSWDLRPCLEDDTADLSITAKYVGVIFNIKESEVCLKEIKGLPDKAGFNEILGKYYSPRQLMKEMREKGVDLFPESDAACYVENIVPKFFIMEDHLYHCMAMISGVFNFHWSRWNADAGRRKVVMLIRNFNDRWHPPEPSTLVVTPAKAILVEATEWDDALSEEPLEGMKFYADLFQLEFEIMSLADQKKVRDTSYKQKETVYKMLTLTRVISFTTSVPVNEKVEFISRIKPKPEKKKKKGKGKGKGKGKKGKKGKK